MNSSKGFSTVGLATCAFFAAWLFTTQPERVHSQSQSQFAPSNLQVHSNLLPTGTQQVVVVNSQNTTMAVYQIDPTHGHIQLTSVRDLNFDLRMQQFNTETPLPSELQNVQP